MITVPSTKHLRCLNDHSQIFPQNHWQAEANLDNVYFVVITFIGSHRKRVDIIWPSFPRQTGSSVLSQSAVSCVFTVLGLCVAGKLIKRSIITTGATHFTCWTEAIALLANQEDEQTRRHLVYLIFPALDASARLLL